MNADDHGRWQPVDNVGIYFDYVPPDANVARFADGPKDGEQLYIKDIGKPISFYDGIPDEIPIGTFTYENIRGTNIYIPEGNSDRCIRVSIGVSDIDVLYDAQNGAQIFSEVSRLMDDTFREVLNEKGWEWNLTRLVKETVSDCVKTMRKICKRLYYVYE